MPYDPLDTPELVRMCQRGDREAFGELVRRFQDRLIANFLGRGCTREQAEDHSQATFLQAYRRIETCVPESFAGWLFKIGINFLRDGFRAESRRISHLRAKWEELRRGERRRIEKEMRARPSQLDLYEKYWKRLSKEERGILKLRFFVRLSTEEIAQILEMSGGAVRMRISRIIRKLRDWRDGGSKDE